MYTVQKSVHYSMRDSENKKSLKSDFSRSAAVGHTCGRLTGPFHPIHGSDIVLCNDPVTFGRRLRYTLSLLLSDHANRLSPSLQVCEFEHTAIPVPLSHHRYQASGTKFETFSLQHCAPSIYPGGLQLLMSFTRVYLAQVGTHVVPNPTRI